MSLLNCSNLTIGFSGPPVLDGVSFSLAAGERAGLLGRNGEGKSTLLRIIASDISADSGEVQLVRGSTVAYLTQEVPEQLDGTVYDFVSLGLGKPGQALALYHQLTLRLADGDSSVADELDKVHHSLDQHNGWDLGYRVETLLDQLGLDADLACAGLSAGMKRRVLLARQLIAKPDILLLDEPTNHLDIPAIEGLESFLRSFPGAILFTTHDRAFLDRLATVVLDLDRGNLTRWDCGYTTFLTRKADALEAESAQAAEFDRKLAKEERWLRQGIKARRTRNEGRVRALKKLREERRARREKIGTVDVSSNVAERSGTKVIVAKDVEFRYPGGTQSVFSGFSTTVNRGDRIGLVGPNGVGKSTLLKVMLGQLTPTGGSVTHGTSLEIAYFDQLREQLNPQSTVWESVADGNESVRIGGQNRHVLGYLQDFLFLPERSRSKVSMLSGGERNRLLLARILARPSNVLVLDEPTNDLDLETLEMLEEFLLSYPGTVLLVSHDRAFIENVVTHLLVLEGDGRVQEFVGGYNDWDKLCAARELARKQPSAPVAVKKVEAVKPAKKLGYKETQELAQLPLLIEELEAEIATLTAALADPDVYRDGGAKARDLQQQLATAESRHSAAFKRWEQLDQ